MAEPFRPMPVPDVPLWRRVSRRPLPGGSLAALLNLLAAAKDVGEVTEADLARIVAKHRHDPRVWSEPRLRTLYAEFLARCLADSRLDEHELRSLEHLRRLFRLNDHAVERAHAAGLREAYRREVADGRLGEQERAFLEELERRLKLPHHVARRIYEDEARGRLRAALNEAVRDERLTDEEHADLVAMAANLGVSLAADELSRRSYERLRLYWIIENGELHGLPCLPRLAAGEKCVAVRRGAWWEAGKANGTVPPDPLVTARAVHLRPATVRRRLTGVDSGRRLDRGRVYLTTRRVLFIGRMRTLNLSLRHIVGLRPFADGVELELLEGTPPFLAMRRDVDLFALLLARVLRDRSAATA